MTVNFYYLQYFLPQSWME